MALGREAEFTLQQSESLRTLLAAEKKAKAILEAAPDPNKKPIKKKKKGKSNG
jgi:hypothetical protein